MTNCVIIILILSVIPVFSQNKAVIRLADETTVESEQILLGGIAQISANEEKSKRLREISLGFSPNIGSSREITRDRILLMIAAAGFAANDFNLYSAEKIRVFRSSQTVNQDLIRQAVEKAVIANFQTASVSINITKLDLPEKIELPKGNVEIRDATMAGVRNFLAPFTVLLEIRIDGKTIHRTSVNVAIETFAEVLVMNKNLAANEKITENDVHLAKVRLEKPLANYLSEAEKLRGKKLLKSFSADEPLLLSSIISDSVIRIGDSVKILGQAEKMQIIVLGEARSNGRIGDRIPVKNLQSGVILQAIVVEEGLVKVKF